MGNRKGCPYKNKHIMKTKLHRYLTLPLFALLFFAAGVSAQDVQLHYFNFNDSPASGVNWPQPVTATVGSGTITYNFSLAVSFAGTTINGNEGEVNGGSFCPQGGTDSENNGKHLILHLPTTDHEHIVVSYPTRRTSTGFNSHAIEYTVDGETWTDFAVKELTGFENNWVASQLFTLDFSEIAAVNNNSAFAIRITLDGATSASGNNRFDNISVRGKVAGGSTGIPESALETVLAYPNPAHHILYVYTTSEMEHISLIDLTGRTVFETRHDGRGNQLGIDVSGLTAGTYLLHVVSENQVRTQKILLGR